MINNFVAWLVGIVTGIVNAFPNADTAAVAAQLQPITRFVCWMMQLNETFPVVEMLAAIGILLGIYTGMYVVMIVRRSFSLLWPGAGG